MATMPKPSHKVVSIEVFADGHATPDPIMLIKNNGDSAEFCSDRDVDVLFDFAEGSPFKQSKFPVPAHTCTQSGPVRPDAAKGNYRYRVKPAGAAHAGGDPTIIVN